MGQEVKRTDERSCENSGNKEIHQKPETFPVKQACRRKDKWHQKDRQLNAQVRKA